VTFRGLWIKSLLHFLIPCNTDLENFRLNTFGESNMTQVLNSPSMPRRQLLSYVTGGTIAATTLAALYPVVRFLMAPTTEGAAAGVISKDKKGNPILVDKLLAETQISTPVLSLGLEVNGGDPTYIIVDNQKEIAWYGVNAVCTHLGCVVPWDAGANKFICQCHGSQYDAQGGLVRGPAPLPLALVKAEVKNNQVLFSPWTEDDFRCTEKSCNKKPYWVGA
jgi:cytochrome b6-f complex iron-sulfur subunit